MHVRNLPRSAWSKAAAIAVVLLIAVLMVTGTTVVIIGGRADRQEPNPRPTSSTERTDDAPDSIPSRGEVAETSNPEAFAVSVASMLFDWDTTDPTPLENYTNRLIEIADPSGEESPGLVTDLTTYLPSPESWADLKIYRTRQWIDVHSYEVPSEWESAELNGETTNVAAGTTAYTITGLRRRSGLWEGKPAQTVDEVSFTIFMTCRPTYDTCRLLRLSQLNNPLR